METPRELEALANLVTLSGVEIKPNGRSVAFIAAPLSVAASSRSELERDLWTVSAAGQCDRVWRGSLSKATPRWSADGTQLAFAVLGEEGVSRLKISRSGGSIRSAAAIPGVVESISWSGNSATVLVLTSDIGLDRAGVEGGTRIDRENSQDDDDPVIHTGAETWRRLYAVNLSSGSLDRVGPPNMNVWEVGWSGLGLAAAIVSDEANESAWYEARIALLDLNAGTVTDLTRSEWQLQSPAVSSDDRFVAFVEGCCSDRAILAGEIVVHDMRTRRVERLAPELDVSRISWIEDSQLAYFGLRGVETMCGRLSLRGEIDEVWRGSALLGTPFRPDGAVSPDGIFFAAAREAPGEPPEICVCDSREDRRIWKPLTRMNSHLAAYSWPTAERLAWRASDGLDVEGILLRPLASDADGARLIIAVHGGPTAAWTYSFAGDRRGYPLALALAGYAVLLPNPRGSAGRGQAFACANIGDLGGDDLTDVLAGVEKAIAVGVGLRDRIGIMGASYGGFMAAWAPTQTDHFSASVSVACISNWLSFHNTTNVGAFDQQFLRADPYDADGAYAHRSPVLHAKDCSTPVLLLHGADDRCTPPSQAEEFYHALLEARCKVELVVYPREGHVLREREHLLDFWSRSQKWFDANL